LKTGIGYLCVGALAFCIAMLWNDGIALAEMTGTAWNMLEQTEKTTVKAPMNLTSGVTDLLSADEVLLSVDGLAAGLETVTNTADTAIAPVTNAVGTVVNSTADISTQISAALSETISSTVQILPEPLPSAVEVTVCALDQCLQIESQRPLEVPKTPKKPFPEDEPAPEPEPKEDPGGKNDGHTAPDARLENKPDRADAEAVREDDPKPREALAIEMEQEEGRSADVAAHLEPAQAPVRSANDEPSPWRNNAIPNAVPGAVTNTQTQSATGHGGSQYHPKLSDAILAEIISMQNSGRRIYAKNTRQLITKRGNEPPTPPPKNSFFS
jgi:hypothetical protein